MVVMEYIEGQTLATKINGRKIGPGNDGRNAIEDFTRLSCCYTGRGLVFGDITVQNTGKAKLIDFNWAGEEGQVKYPYLIPWPQGVEALQ